jgi:lactosylceramide 4-alpha-galactosyltransferase
MAPLSNYYIWNRLLPLSYLRHQQGIRLVHLVGLFVCFVAFFLYLTVFFNWKVVSVWSSERFNISRVQQKVSIDTKVDLSKCCVSPGSWKDICGQSNCTLTSCPAAAAASPQTLNQQLKPDRHNAFFLETSGNGEFLTIRQACAVESLAFHNPNLTVNVLFMMDNASTTHSSRPNGINQSKVLPAETNLDKLKEKYNNIEFITLNLDDYVAGTLLEKWYHCNDWRKGQYHVAHLSDGLRLLTLHKFGGYYFDLDIIFVRRVTYYHNFVSAEASNSLCNNAIHVDYGHPVIQLAVRDFPLHYR